MYTLNSVGLSGDPYVNPHVIQTVVSLSSPFVVSFKECNVSTVVFCRLGRSFRFTSCINLSRGTIAYARVKSRVAIFFLNLARVICLLIVTSQLDFSLNPSWLLLTLCTSLALLADAASNTLRAFDLMDMGL